MKYIFVTGVFVTLVITSFRLRRTLIPYNFYKLRIQLLKG